MEYVYQDLHSFVGGYQSASGTHKALGHRTCSIMRERRN